MYLPPPVVLGRALTALVALFLFTACDDSSADSVIAADAGSGSDSEVDAGAGSGAGSGALNPCWLEGVPVEKCPVQPRGNLPADCPSGRVFESADFAAGTGPCVPSMPDWDCPDGWRSVPGFTDGSGNEDVPEGMTQFSICEPPEGSNWVGAPEGSGTVGAPEGSGTVGAPEGSGTVGAPELPPTPTDCPAGTIAVPGDVACRPMGSPCPTAAERWASEADLRARAPGYDGPVVYVAADAAAHEAGTRERPLPLDEAVNAAAPGSLLALALGTYDAAVAPDGSALVGACVSGTVIAPAAENPDLGAIELTGSNATLVANLTLSGNHEGLVARGGATGVSPEHIIRDVTIVGVINRGLHVTTGSAVDARLLRVDNTRPHPVDQTRGRGIQVDYAASLTLTGATLRNNHDVGIYAIDAGTSVSASRVLVEDTQPDASDQNFGWGIAVLSGASLTLTGATLRNNHQVGLCASDTGTTVSATGLLVEDTQPQASDQMRGRGMDVEAGASLILTRATLRNNHDIGLIASGSGSTVEASGLLVEDTQPQASDQTGGRGIYAQDGASLTLTGATLRNNHDLGIFVADPDTTVEATGLLIEDTQPQASDQTTGWGIAVQDGAALTVVGATLRNNHDVGLFADGSGSTIAATSLLIESTQPNASDQTLGWGIAVQNGAALTLTGATLRNNHDIGLFTGGAGATVEATGLLIEDTQPQASDQTTGWGIGVQEGAALTLKGATVRNNHELGLVAFSVGTVVTAEGLLVEGTQPQASDQMRGIGIGVQDGAALELTGATLRNNHAVGLFASDAGTTVTATGLLVAATQPQASDGRFGDGLLLTDGASLTGTDMTLWENARCGLQMAFDGVAVAVQGALIGRNAIGTNLQSSDFTRADLAVGLRSETYWENGLDLGAEALPLPDPLEALESLDPISP
jgi:hypothetical protein